MIVGTGIDIIDTIRVGKTIKNFGKKFINRCFVENEIKTSNLEKNKIHFFAKRFAAKEACSKALSTGLAYGITWKDIEVFNDKFGKPNIILHNKALKLINKITYNSYKIHLSLSDEKNYAIASVIIQRI